MRLLKSVSFACLALGVSAVCAEAQDRGQLANPVRQDGYLVGGAGIASGPHTGAVFSAEVAEKIGPVLQAYAAFHYFDDLMADATREELASAARQFEAITLTPWEFQGRDRGRTFTTGIKAALPGRVRPYVAGGVGVLNLKRIISERTLGDVSEGVRAAYALEGAVVPAAQSTATRPMVEAGTGVGLILGRVYIDAGYRYRRAFHVFGEAFDFSQVTTSLGIAF
jgi:hypothetical protein